MGKLVKFCGPCDEGFAEKFGFCPNCGKTLEAFEMSPVAADSHAVSFDSPVPALPAAVSEPVPLIEVPMSATSIDDEAVISGPAIEGETIITPAQPTARYAPYVQSRPIDVDRVPASGSAAPVQDDAFHITVIEEKNGGQRNTLMLGTLGLMIVGLMTALIINIFTKDLEVGSINDDFFNAVLVDDVWEIKEEEIEKQNNKDDDGGGGGGGNNDPRPASKGERPPMRTEPEFKPSATADRLTNPAIPIQMAIKGPVNERSRTSERYGVLNGSDISSNGPGTGGGIGPGRGGGVGPGNGPGYGPGSNGGLGGGKTGGLGPGDGPGGSEAPPPEKRVGVTSAIKILSKPRPGYTDPARQNNIQGTVILRVTFLASGTVGSISPVKGLPNGLTEQAIAAARRINFEPAKRDGVAQTVTKQIEYSFSIY